MVSLCCRYKSTDQVNPKTKLVNVELPCWVGLTGLHGRLRLRLEMVPDPPFVRHVCFSFPVLPEIEIVAKVDLLFPSAVVATLSADLS